MRLLSALTLAGFLCAGLAVPARADVFSLDLSGLQDREAIDQYFNGGTGSLGTGSGPDYGIYFSDPSGATAQTNPDNDGFANAPFSNNAVAYFSQFPDFAPVYLDAPGGITGGFSFWYSNGSGDPETINLYSGLDGTGGIVATIALLPNDNPGDCSGSASFCDWAVAGASFADTVQSVGFADLDSFDNLETVFADITIGSSSPVPEPASIAMLGMGIAALGRARRRKLT